MLKHLKKYWLEYVFFILLLNAVLCAIGFVHEEIPIEYHKIEKADNKWGEEPLDSYLDRVFRMDEYVIMIAGTELNDQLISDEVFSKLISMGIPVMENRTIERRNGLIALLSNGKLVDAKVSEGNPISYSGYLNRNYVLLEENQNNYNEPIYINDVSYSLGRSGLNIVIFDEKEECIIDSVNYNYNNGRINIER